MRILSPSRWACFLLLAGTLFVASAPAHDSMKSSIRHELKLKAGPKNIDIEADLTFFAEPALKERFRMDTDGDGVLSRAETDAYVDCLRSELEDRLEIRAGGRRLPSFLLYRPELDLLSNTAREPHPITLRVVFFARTPADLAPGFRITVHDGLWPSAPGIHMWEARGIDGVEISADRTKPPSRGTDGDARVVSAATCVRLDRAAAALLSRQDQVAAARPSARIWGLRIWLVLSIALLVPLGRRLRHAARR
jgi:hypothetical protein